MLYLFIIAGSSLSKLLNLTDSPSAITDSLKETLEEMKMPSKDRELQRLYFDLSNMLKNKWILTNE
jgi:hypothetical protein